MDNEGYPLVQPGARLQPIVDRPDSIDEESGEATGRRVVVLRKTQLDTRHSMAAENSHFPYHLLHDLSCHHTSRSKSVPRTSQSFMFHQELPRVPPLWSGDNGLVDSVYNSHTDPGTEYSRPISRVPFRVSQLRPETKPRDKREVTISIWKEFCRGSLVYEDANASWNDVKDKCLLWPHLQALFGDFAVAVPLCCVWLVRIVLLMLKVFVPWLGLQLTYFHLLYVHLKIHVTGEKKGVHPVFIGAASQGPIIYSIRHLWCPYCRYNKQCQVTLRYFEILLQERQSMATR